MRPEHGAAAQPRLHPPRGEGRPRQRPGRGKREKDIPRRDLEAQPNYQPRKRLRRSPPGSWSGGKAALRCPAGDSRQVWRPMLVGKLKSIREHPECRRSSSSADAKKPTTSEARDQAARRRFARIRDLQRVRRWNADCADDAGLRGIVSRSRRDHRSPTKHLSQSVSHPQDPRNPRSISGRTAGIECWRIRSARPGLRPRIAGFCASGEDADCLHHGRNGIS